MPGTERHAAGQAGSTAHSTPTFDGVPPFVMKLIISRGSAAAAAFLAGAFLVGVFFARAGDLERAMAACLWEVL